MMIDLTRDGRRKEIILSQSYVICYYLVNFIIGHVSKITKPKTESIPLLEI